MTNENDVERLKEECADIYNTLVDSDIRYKFHNPSARDVINMTIDHLAASGRLAGWREIDEDTPTDGTIFEAREWYDSINDFMTPFKCKYHDKWVDKGFVDIDRMADGIKHPNQWRPLPPAPSARNIENNGEKC